MAAMFSEKNSGTRNVIFDFEQRIDQMHDDFNKYLHDGVIQKLPEWEHLERDLLIFSRRKIFDLELSKQLDRIMYKFQNRKKIWLKWAEEVSRKE